MSLSLCPCRGTSPKAAAHYGWPCLFTSSGGPFRLSQHTPHTKRDLSRGSSKSSYHLCSEALLLLFPPLKPMWPWSFPAVKNPAAIKCLLLLPNFLLRKDHSSTMYLIHNLRGSTHWGVPSSALHTTTSVANGPLKICHRLLLLIASWSQSRLELEIGLFYSLDFIDQPIFPLKKSKSEP